MTKTFYPNCLPAVLLAVGWLALCSIASAQPADPVGPEAPAGTAAQTESTEPATPDAAADPASSPAEPSVTEEIRESANEAQRQVEGVAEQIDRNPTAQEFSAGILKPIYAVAEAFSFSAFHWVAFAVMVAGVVSFGLQLVLGKLVVLAKMGFSFSEVLSDAFGLLVCVLGLGLTTQAATENSNFTDSAASVLSATAVGAVFGLILYVWGQRIELQAAAGRKQKVVKK